MSPLFRPTYMADSVQNELSTLTTPKDECVYTPAQVYVGFGSS